MLRASEVLTASTDAPVGTVHLDFDARHRRRHRLRTDTGLEFLLDLPKARHLRDGEHLILDDGRCVLVTAAPEPLLEVRGRDAHHLLRLAWHIGNRHLAAELADGAIYLRDDHVIAAMLSGLGAMVQQVARPFDPEGGAYDDHAGGHAH